MAWCPPPSVGGVAETGVTTLDKKSDCYRIVFKIRRLFDLTVIKWEELLNATVQPGVDWEITATPVKDPYVKAQTETTDVGGRAQFTLTPGKWILTENVKAGWVPVTPSQVTIVLDQYDPPGAMNAGDLQEPGTGLRQQDRRAEAGLRHRRQRHGDRARPAGRLEGHRAPRR